METVERSIEVDVPLRAVYDQWTRFEEFPEFMEDVERVTPFDGGRLHWVVRVGGQQKEWDAEITEQIPDNRIAWRSISGVANSGVVRFQAPDPNRTLISVRIDYEPENAMEKIAAAFGVVEGKIDADLLRFKDFIEHQSAASHSQTQPRQF